MKKFLLVLVCLSFAGVIFAVDQIATLGNGTKVVLHDNGKWEYYSTKNSGDVKAKILGTWKIDEDSWLESMLASDGIYKNDPQYALYISYYRSMGGGLLPDISFTFSENTCKISMDGEELIGEYTIDSERVVTIKAPNGNSAPMAVFNKDYTELYMAGSTEFIFIKQ